MSETPAAPVAKPEPKLYAVFRNGFRVSPTDYPDPFFAQDELNYWKRIISRWPDGSKLRISELRPWKARPTPTKEVTNE